MSITKEQIIDALRAFARQRPGIEPGNYGSWQSYRQESASVTRDLHDALALLRACEWRTSITGQAFQDAARSGRLTLEDDGRVNYTTGQYFPVEYRRAVARLCASVLWGYHRNNACGPDGDALRATCRKEYGKRLADRYFN